MNRFAPAFILLGALCSGCSTSAVTQFGANAAAVAVSINTVNNSIIQLNTTIINNTAQLAAALAKVECPIINASVSLGKAIAADPNVSASVKAKLNKAGPAGALVSDVCAAAGFGPTAAVN